MSRAVSVPAVAKACVLFGLLCVLYGRIMGQSSSSSSKTSPEPGTEAGGTSGTSGSSPAGGGAPPEKLGAGLLLT